jgi:hypothetical protein
MSELRFDDVGKRQVEVEETFLLQRGIIHPFNKLCEGCREGQGGAGRGREGQWDATVCNSQARISVN